MAVLRSMESVKLHHATIVSAMLAAWLCALVVLNAGCKASPQPPASSQAPAASAAGQPSDPDRSDGGRQLLRLEASPRRRGVTSPTGAARHAGSASAPTPRTAPGRAPAALLENKTREPETAKARTCRGGSGCPGANSAPAAQRTETRQ